MSTKSVSKYVNLVRVRQRLVEMAEQICEEEGLPVRVAIQMTQAPNDEKKNITIEVVEMPNRQPREIVN